MRGPAWGAFGTMPPSGVPPKYSYFSMGASRGLRGPIVPRPVGRDEAPRGGILLGAMPRRGKVIRFPTAPPEPRDEPGLVEVHRCDRSEAVVVQGLFESEGIPALLRSRLPPSLPPRPGAGQGGGRAPGPPGAPPRGRRPPPPPAPGPPPGA